MNFCIKHDFPPHGFFGLGDNCPHCEIEDLKAILEKERRAVNKFRGVMFNSDGSAGDALNELMSLVPQASDSSEHE